MKKIFFMTSTILISALLSFVLLGFSSSKKGEPKEVYRVYLNDKVIALINSKSELEDYIDKEQQELKEKYKVNKVYSPTGLKIVKYYTHNEKITRVKDVYELIKDLNPFTIKGYVYSIPTGDETKTTINVTDKDMFEKAAIMTVKSFVSEEAYDNYDGGIVPEITSTGRYIEKIDTGNITYKETYIPTDEMIFTNEHDLAKFILFGTLEKQATYTVKVGDTIDKIAFDNKLSPEEFLLANPELTNVNNLLFPGQEVSIGLISPQIDVAVMEHIVSDQVKKFETETVYDYSLPIGTISTTQEGEDGIDRITQKQESVNGEITNVVIASREVIKPVVNKIVTRGGKATAVTPGGKQTIISPTGWAWPTITPYVISSGFGWRWGSLHDGTDISGCGYGSNIYASRAGTIVKATYHGSLGYHIIIDHHDGIYTSYLHLSKFYVSEGQTVEQGQVIAGMGNSGYVVGASGGIHLHFSIWVGLPYAGTGAYAVDACPYIGC